MVFKDGAQFGAWLGLTPRQNSSGGKNNLGSITKRGDMYVRMLLIQGAKSAVMTAHKRDEPYLKVGAPIAREVGLAEGCRGAGQQKCTNTLGDVRARQALRCAPCKCEARAACAGDAGGHGHCAGIAWWGKLLTEIIV